MKKKQQTQTESMNHEDQTHKEMKIKPIKKNQQTHEDHNKEETTKALGRSNIDPKLEYGMKPFLHEPKQQRSNPNREYQTRKIKPKQRRSNHDGEGD